MYVWLSWLFTRSRRAKLADFSAFSALGAPTPAMVSLAKGSVVWAKLPAFPWWPAVVQSVDAHEVDVTFCGTQDLGSVAKDSVYPYATKLGWCDTKQKERWKKKFRQAVDEAATLHEAQLQLGGGMPTTLLVGGSTSQAEAQDTHVLEAVAAEPPAEEADSNEDSAAVSAAASGGRRCKSTKRNLPADPGLPGWTVVEHDVRAVGGRSWPPSSWPVGPAACPARAT